MSNVVTYEDVLANLAAFAKARDISAPQDTLRYAVESALRDIISARDWKCLRKTWRVPLQVPQTTGTATYSASGGAYPYLVTLSGATVPSWAADAQFRIGTYSTVCDVDQVISSTQFTLRSPRIPLEDVTTASTYSLGRSWYELPQEFVTSWSPIERNVWFVGKYVPFEEWHLLEQYDYYTGVGIRWTIGPAPNRYGTMALYVHPWPSSVSDLNFVMKCRPRPLAISGQESWCYAGTATVAANGTTVTGSSTIFKSIMAGAIIRFSDGSTKPTGTNGVNPYVFQQSITSVDTATQTLTLGAGAPVGLTGVKYTVSDPLDLDIGLYNAFVRNCEMQLTHAAGAKDAAGVERQWQLALQSAKIADNSTRPRETAGSAFSRRLRLADYYRSTLE